MLELAVLLTLVTLVLAVVGGLGVVAVLAGGVAMMAAVIFVDWLRHTTRPARHWTLRRFGTQLRALHRVRTSLLLWGSLGAFLAWLAYLWVVMPPGA
jgi:hypothetical protein